MRTLLRTLAATAALTALLIGAGASGALAASDQGNPAHTYRNVFHDEWCFDGGETTDCSIADGTVAATTTPDGREIGRIHYTLDVTTYDAAGTVVGTRSTRTFDRVIVLEDGSGSLFTLERYTATGVGEDCAYGYKLSMVDDELKMEKFTGPGCN
jgi:hypothetical protein